MARQTEMHLERHIGERIRRRRTELGLTQEELGQGLDISYQQIQKYESGANRISASRLHTLAERLGVEVAWFLDGFKSGEGPVARDGRQRAAVELARTFDGIEGADVRAALGALVRAVVDRQALTPAR
ncbi:MAG: helix-turn-helix transcriptional regulator [Geminicoccaceae bacterium]|nr:helix-turn-helix transcriptional regulator [Geminicoccaceae bacterium]